MPLWIYNRPPSETPTSERDTAAHWQRLPAGFRIRWGYSFQDGATWREGDFVIQGPEGHLLVVEAKSGAPEPDPATGEWNTEDGSNPVLQLEKQWSGVVRMVREEAHQMGIRAPWVAQALALPHVEMDAGQFGFAGGSRHRILAGTDLKYFEEWWASLMDGRRLGSTLGEAQSLFDRLFVKGKPAGSNTWTLDFADRLIERQTRTQFEVLDALEFHSQFLFRGGPGTGKTWVALELARRWTAAGRGVLFLCYNLELERWLRTVCGRLAPGVAVYSFESLGTEFLGCSAPPTDPAARRAYYDAVLPQCMVQRVQADDFQPSFDAWIVDEAQDHDTAPDPSDAGPGWWGIYPGLVRGGWEAPIAVFADGRQRLARRQGAYDESRLLERLPGIVQVVLKRPLRYTRQLAEFFAGMSGWLWPEMAAWNVGSSLPEGPEPELLEARSDAEEAARVAEVLERWFRLKLVVPADVLLLYPSSSRIPPWLGAVPGIVFHAGAEGCPPEAVAAVSVHKAKGLDRRAVVLVGLPPWEALGSDPYLAQTYGIGVTRAQQLLCVVSRSDLGTISNGVSPA